MPADPQLLEALIRNAPMIRSWVARADSPSAFALYELPGYGTLDLVVKLRRSMELVVRAGKHVFEVAANDVENGWAEVPKTHAHLPETQSIDAEDQDVVAMVDVRRFCWYMVCAHCGRKRYSTTNNKCKITACRVCAARQRRQAKNRWQQAKRK